MILALLKPEYGLSHNKYNNLLRNCEACIFKNSTESK